MFSIRHLWRLVLGGGRLEIFHEDPTDEVGSICPGRHIAWSLLWITVASMLATMNITKAVDENGVVIEPSGEYTSVMDQSVSKILFHLPH